MIDLRRGVGRAFRLFIYFRNRDGIDSFDLVESIIVKCRFSILFSSWFVLTMV